jgi:hypothetical protein
MQWIGRPVWVSVTARPSGLSLATVRGTLTRSEETGECINFRLQESKSLFSIYPDQTVGTWWDTVEIPAEQGEILVFAFEGGAELRVGLDPEEFIP